MSNILFPNNHHQLPYSCLLPFFLQSIKTHLLSTHKGNSSLSFWVSLLCSKKKIFHSRNPGLLLWTLPDFCQEVVYESQFLNAHCFPSLPCQAPFLNLFTASGLFHGPQIRDFSSELLAGYWQQRNFSRKGTSVCEVFLADDFRLSVLHIYTHFLFAAMF